MNEKKTAHISGGMSLKRHEFSTGSFVFNDLRAFGFAIFDYLEDPKNQEKANKMFRWLQVITRSTLYVQFSWRVAINTVRNFNVRLYS